MSKRVNRLPWATLGVAALALLMVPAASAADSWGESWLVEVPESSVVVKGWRDLGVDHYAIALDGETFLPARQTSYELRLRGRNFDPRLDAAPPIPESLLAGPESNVFLVQFVTQPLEPYRRALRELGVEIHKFFPRHAYIAHVPREVRDRVAALPFVRWMGPYHAAYRTEPFVYDALTAATDTLGTRIYSIQLFSPDDAVKELVGRRIESIGGDVEKLRDGKFLMLASLSRDQLTELLGWDEVAHADRWSPLQPDMDIVRQVGGANFLEAVEGYTGQGVRAEVFDSGFNVNHDDLQSNPVIEHNNVSGGDHGASTSGIIFGDGTSDPRGRGLMPDGQPIVGDYDLVGLDGIARYDYTSELLGAPYFAVFSSCSAGSDRTQLYNTISAGMDTMLFDLDLLACQSQSNAGNQNSRPQAWAKNIVAVGGIRHKDTMAAVDDEWDFGASIGPAEDGRMKPDMAHFYDSVYTISWPGDASHTEFSGTSAATPIVCGHAGLFFQMWSEGIFGNPVDPNGTVFENRPHMTTAKAALINTSRQYDWLAGGNNSDIDRPKQGWGIPNLRGLYAVRNQVFVVDESDVLSNLESTSYDLTVAPGTPLFRATMVYAEPAGVPGADQHRINNLSLQVTSPSGTEYWGNWGLRQRLLSEPGGTENEIDTVENVYLRNPEPGTWTVTVTATEIVEDGHVETAQMDADYALWVSGVTP